MKISFSCFLQVVVVCVLSTASNASTKSRIEDSFGGGAPLVLDKQHEVHLPPVEQWPHRPVFLSTSSSSSSSPLHHSNATTTALHSMGLSSGESPLPLGVPFPIHTSLFKGHMLVRLRHSNQEEDYFRGHNNKRVLMQIVVQGRFQRRGIRMSEISIGSRFDRPLRLAPPFLIQRALRALLQRASPGVHMDLTSERPIVSALYAGSVKTMRMDAPGQEPPLTSHVLPEKTSFHGRRTKVLSKPSTASRYEFDTDLVYTFHTADEVMDYARYRMRIPMFGTFDLRKVFGRQPVQLSAETRTGETLFAFKLFHESLLNTEDDV